MTKKPIKIALYNPFLDILGGGEKHILSIIFTLADLLEKENKNNVDIYIFWDKDLTKEIVSRFSFQCFKTLKWLPKKNLSSSINCLKNLKDFNYFFYVTDGSYFFSSAKKNFVFSMIPDKKLYQMNLLNKLKLLNYKFISNSFYTSSWLLKWPIKSIIITPYIDDNFFNFGLKQKEKIILSVGRFFSHLHSKNQDLIIKTFKKLKQKYNLFKEFKLILAGGLKEEDRDYFEYLKKISDNDLKIIFKTNLSQEEIYQLYKLSSYFWHFTGLGVDENKHPDQVEHFGIAPLEAIASGCLTFCHNSGNPKLIIENEKTGFLFNNEDELIKKMVFFEKKQNLKNKVITQGIKMVKNNFNYNNFKKLVLKLI